MTQAAPRSRPITHPRVKRVGTVMADAGASRPESARSKGWLKIKNPASLAAAGSEDGTF